MGAVAGLRLALKLEAGMGMAFKVPNLVRDAGGFDTMVAAVTILCFLTCDS